MTKLLVITPFFYPHTGGSQQYMEDLYATIVGNFQISVDVLCYNTDHALDKQVYKGMIIYRIPCWQLLQGQFALPSPWALLKFLISKKNNYQLIHCSTRFFDSSWWAPIYAKVTGKKIILTDHCATHPVHHNFLVTQIARLIDKKLTALSLPLYDRIFVSNYHTQKFIKNTYGLNSMVVYPGTDTSLFRPITKTEKKRLRIIFAGRMIESKGVLILFAIASEMSDLDFIFAGPGPLVSRLQEEAKRKKYRHIKVLGGLDKRSLAKALANADIFIHPSHHHEGFPNALIEAGVSRLAIIATDVGGTKEIIINGKTGLLIRPNSVEELKEALQKLVKYKILRAKLATGLYHHILKNFTWENSSKLMIKEIGILTKKDRRYYIKLRPRYKSC